MKDLDIIKQLLNGNHLEDQELARADKLIYLIGLDLKSRIRGL